MFSFLYKKRKNTDLVSSAFILFSISLLLYTTQIFSRLDHLVFDVGQNIGISNVPDDVIIVAIDENSLSQLGRWPWPRNTHAQFIQRLTLEKPAVIGFDVIFSEPDQINPKSDANLADAIALAGNVVLPVLLETTRANGPLIETMPLPLLAEKAADMGRVHAVLDEDSIARSVYLFEGVNTPAWQLFAQAILNVAEKTPSKNQFGLTSLLGNQYALTRKDQRRINFLGPSGHFASISYAQVINGEFAKDLFKDKIVLVGATALGMNDLLSTPVSGLGLPMAGVEFHANVLESIRKNRLIKTVSFILGAFILALLAIAPLLWMPKQSALMGFLSTLCFMVLIAVLFGMLPRLWAFWIPPSAALVPLLLAYPIWSWRKLQAAQQYLDVELAYLKQHLNVASLNDHALVTYDQFEARITQVRTATQQLRYLQEDRRETLAFISHDLRAPIAASLVILEKHDQLRAQLQKPLSQALYLAEDFLQTSRAEMVDANSFQELDLTGLIHQAADDAFEVAQQKNMQLVRVFVGGIVWVNGNFGLLHRAALNLILNAIKYGQADTNVVITIGLNNTQTKVTFSVTNQGVGIALTEQESLFERFSRAKGHEKMADGTGLGLYFVRTVVEKHGGKMTLDSDLSKPTTFSIHLPAQGFLADH